MNVPFFDLRATHDEIHDEIMAAVAGTLQRSNFILGPELERFEAEFAAYCGARHCIGVASGLDALRLILLAYGIGPGDEVIVPAHTFIASWLAVTEAGARPVGVDIDPATYNLDPSLISAAVTPKTRAIMPVHLYGRPADMAAINEVAAKHNLVVIEDAAQAHGATVFGKRAGGLGGAAAFSFYPTKNLGALGDGGAIVTSDDEVARRARTIRNYGSEKKYHHVSLGTNSRLDEMQAAILRVKLQSLDAKNEARQRLVQRYLERLKRIEGLVAPEIDPRMKSVWHLLVVQTPGRDALAEHLSSHGISTLVHYPIPPHLQEALAHLGYKRGDFPVAERAAEEVLSLPLWPEMSDSHVDRVLDALEAWNGYGRSS